MSKLSENQKAMLYDALIETFIESKAENYLSLIFERDGVDMYEVVIQKINGMTPAEKNLALEQKIAKLEKNLKMLERYNGSVESLVDGLAAHNLEQQAKGVDDCIHTLEVCWADNIGDCVLTTDDLYQRKFDLLDQAKQLREGKK